MTKRRMIQILKETAANLEQGVPNTCPACAAAKRSIDMIHCSECVFSAAVGVEGAYNYVCSTLRSLMDLAGVDAGADALGEDATGVCFMIALLEEGDDDLLKELLDA